MPGPFPGMDPYLEAPERWPDVHQSLITYIRDALQPLIRPRYLARMGERVYVQPTPHVMYPDVLIMHPPLREATVAYLDWVVQVAEDPAPPDAADRPVVLMLDPVEHREPFVEIVAAGGGDVVTVIEVLSLANKTPGEGHRQYRRKQRELLAGAVNLVEIDLLSQGLWTIAWEEELRACCRHTAIASMCGARRTLTGAKFTPFRYRDVCRASPCHCASRTRTCWWICRRSLRSVTTTVVTPSWSTMASRRWPRLMRMRRCGWTRFSRTRD